ncbi:hypothetical protein [Paramaledivibacter caminithermalis]|jgi:phage FluMu protein Com|uniref:Uncharacterized protein n=1 Tax=Paramaledivibacter caminithermalis (strain DSM 15212 / CIP 107654 / DViRD3) TaxID=1121301 RepID=A0A1M6NBE6_PARC5|nr:hypothetical protein [Paramaledivibacter caminithermalis]SHJ93058.1 hypothetical protein SAMN02745912_01653 [Paramaledivibacter caminithermalis DSM 15212]
MSIKLCRVCNKPLHESQRLTHNGIKIKSCPKCSTLNGKEHVYYEEHVFGFTDERITHNNTDGIQSYCAPCRSDKLNTIHGIMCNQI